MNNYPCICGHTKYEHGRLSYIIGCAAYITAGHWCYCNIFKQDNLKYLEDKYDENIKNRHSK